MPPLDLFSSQEFWTAVIVALVGGGGVGAIIGAISSRRKDTAQIAAQACDILTDSVIKPLREQVESQEEQIQHLESQQRKYFTLTAYTRDLFHWLVLRDHRAGIPQTSSEAASPGRITRGCRTRDLGGAMTSIGILCILCALVLVFNHGAHLR